MTMERGGSSLRDVIRFTAKKLAKLNSNNFLFWIILWESSSESVSVVKIISSVPGKAPVKTVQRTPVVSVIWITVPVIVMVRVSEVVTSETFSSTTSVVGVVAKRRIAATSRMVGVLKSTVWTAAILPRAILKQIQRRCCYVIYAIVPWLITCKWQVKLLRCTKL